MNSDGGTLLIGVADDGSIVGIENDIASLSTGNLDGFEQAFRQVLADNIGLEFSHLVRSAYEAANRNDDLHWPRRDGLKWPQLASVVVGVDVD